MQLPRRAVIASMLAVAMLAIMGGSTAIASNGEDHSDEAMVGEYTYSTTLQSNSGTVCRLRTNNPHYPSDHAPNRINQSSFVRCSANVYIIKVTTVLQKRVCVWRVCYWRNDARGGVDKKFNRRFLEVHSNKVCSPGTYRGKARQYVLEHPSARPWIVTGYSYPVTINC